MCLCGLLAAESGGLPNIVKDAARAFIRELANRLEAAFANSANPRPEALGVLSQLEGEAMLAIAFENPDIFLSARRSNLQREGVARNFALDLSRFDAAPLIAFTSTKETDYALPGRVMRSMIPRGD